MKGEYHVFQAFHEFELFMESAIRFIMVSIIRNMKPNMSPIPSADAGAGSDRAQSSTTMARLFLIPSSAQFPGVVP